MRLRQRWLLLFFIAAPIALLAQSTSTSSSTITATQINVVSLDAGSVATSTICFDPPSCTRSLTQSAGSLTNTGMSFAMPSLTSINWGVGASSTGIQNGSGQSTGFARTTLGGGILAVPGTFSKTGTVAANSSTTETTLQTAAHLAQFGNDMDVAGRGWHVYAWGTFAANTSAKTLKLKFGPGATDLTGGAFTGTDTTNGGSWYLDCKVIRTTSTSAQSSICFWLTSGATPTYIVKANTATETTGSLDWSIVLTGQGGATNDIAATLMRVDYLP